MAVYWCCCLLRLHQVREQRREVAALKEQLRQEKLTTAVEGR
jgi:hypothetical protein